MLDFYLKIPYNNKHKEIGNMQIGETLMMNDTLFTCDNGLTVDRLIEILEAVKIQSGGNTRVVFEEPVKFQVCDVKGASLKMASGSGRDVITHEDEDDVPENAYPVVCFFNYD